MANRKELPAGITLRKDGRYMWRFKYDGQQYTGYSKKLTEAKKAMRNKRYEVEHGIYGKEKNVSFSAWFEEWLETYKKPVLKESTYDLYLKTYQWHIKPVFGTQKIKSLRTEQIQRFMNDMAREYSKTVAATVNFLLYDSLQQAARNRIIAQNPMENTTPPKYTTPEPKKALTPQHEKELLEAVKDSQYFPVYRAATLSGMRIGELLGLKWECVDFDREEIRVRNTLSYISGKGMYLDTPKSAASRRMIPMNKAGELFKLMKARHLKQLQDRLKAGKYWDPLPGMETLVFTTTAGRPLYDVNIRTHHKKVIKQLQAAGSDIPMHTFHTLRHCFATRCIEAGMDPKTLQAILGHSTMAMTMDLYCDVMEETKREAMKKVQAIL